MTLKAMPKGWVLESGTLGTDLDEDASSYLTGGRSLKFKNTNNLIRVLSEPMPVGFNPGTQEILRTRYGYTAAYAHSGSTGFKALTRCGVLWYDASGAYLSSTDQGITVGIGGGVFETTGLLANAPTNAQFMRASFEHQDATDTVLLDFILPYACPPFGRFETVTPNTLLVLGTWQTIPLDIIISQNATDLSSGSVVVSETGMYHIFASVRLDTYVATEDAFAIRIQDPNGGQSSVFAPAVSKAAMTNAPATGYEADISMYCHKLLKSGDTITLQAVQYAGTLRDVDEANVHITKET